MIVQKNQGNDLIINSQGIKSGPVFLPTHNRWLSCQIIKGVTRQTILIFDDSFSRKF